MTQPSYFLTVPQILGAVRRQWFPAFVLASLLVGGSATTLWLMRNTYISEGQFYLKAGRATMTLDPTSTTGQTFSLMDTRQAEIQSIKEMLMNRQVLEQVAKNVGVQRINEQESVLDMLMSEFKAILPISNEDEEDGVLDPAEAQELRQLENAVKYVGKSLTVTVSKEANTISMTSKAHSPYLARDIVENLMSEFTKRYVEVHRTAGSLEFFEREVAKASETVLAREQQLRDLKNSLKMMSVQSKRELIQQELSELQKQLIETTSQLTAANAEATHLESQLASHPQNLGIEQTDKPSAASEKMREQLYALEMQESELSSKYQDDHPILVAVRDKLAMSREIFDSQVSRIDEKKTAINPLHQKIEGDLIQSLARRESLEAKRSDLLQKMAKVEEKLTMLNADEVRLAEQERLTELARTEYLTTSKKMEEARVRAQLDESLINDLSVAQPASLVLKKVSPQRGMLLGLISAAALFVGLVFAIWRDQQAYFASFTQPVVDYRIGRNVEQTSSDLPMQGELASS